MSQRPPQRSTSRSGARSGARRSAPSRSSREARRRKQLRRRRSAIVAVALASILLLVIGTAFIYGMSLWNKIDFKTRDDFTLLNSVPLNENEFVSENTIENMAGVDFGTGEIRSDSQIRNILLIGADADSGGYGRSDSMLLVSIDDKTGTLKLTSFLRDTYLKIPGQQDNRLNAAYAIGGPALLMETIEQNFRLKIDKYIGINFVVFPIAVDKLGGIEIELTGPEATQIPKKGTTATVETGDPNFVPMSNKPGVYQLDGFQTLQYVRIRHLDSDFGRVQRQQKAMKILLDKARHADIFTLTGMLDDLLPQVKTNMGRGDILNYVMDVASYLSYDIMTDYRVPQNGAYRNETINGGAMLVLKDPKQSVTDLHTYLYA